MRLEFGLGLSRRFLRTIWIVEAHLGDGKRFVVRADEKHACSSSLSELHAKKFLSAFRKKSFHAAVFLSKKGSRLPNLQLRRILILKKENVKQKNNLTPPLKPIFFETPVA
jgi:hypothetical protein